MTEPLPHKPLLTHAQWRSNVFQSIRWALIVFGLSLGMGVVGYHYIAGLIWIDALLEASMILGGMGAIAPMEADAAKLFASFYALYSGLIVISTMAILLAPWLHRLVHRVHHGPLQK
jgi:hypothetical protein